MQAYSDPSRENDTYALPDIEIWSEPTIIYRPAGACHVRTRAREGKRSHERT
jgi:hypothetical protein